MSKKKKKKQTKPSVNTIEKNINEKSGKKELLITVIIIVCALVLITAGLIILFHKEHSEYDTVVLKVGDEKVRKDEINFLMLQNAVDLKISADTLEVSEDTLKSLGVDSADEYYKNEIVKMVMDYKVEYMTAKKQGIIMSDDDKSKVRKDATEYLSGVNARILSELGITKDRIIEIYEQRFLATKLVDETKSGIEVDEPDIDKRFATVYIMLFPKVVTTDDGNYEREADGETPVMLSDDEIKEQKEKADAAYKELTEDNADVEEVAKKYGVEAFSGMQYNLVESFEEPFSDCIKKLKEGEYSNVIDESSFYGIVKMVSENNEQLSEQIMKQYNEDMIDESFNKKLDEWYTELGISKDPVFVGDTWDKITFYDFVKYVGE